MGTDSDNLLSTVSSPGTRRKKEDQGTTWLVTPGLRPAVERFISLCQALFIESENSSRKVPLMICGPSGVGKSMFVDIAKKIHQKVSGKKMERTVNCASLPEKLIESMLFGHVKGSFTDAIKDHVGFVEVVKDGLLILEEIGRLEKNIQAKLLTFIEDHCFYKLGSTTVEHATDIQIIATTNSPKEDFREDFWFRFFPFFVPPLHERRLDVLYYFFHMYPQIRSLLMPWEILMLLTYNWPGNVREIQRLGRVALWRKRIQAKQPHVRLPVAPLMSGSANGIELGKYASIGPHRLTELENQLLKNTINTIELDKMLMRYSVGHG